MRIFHANKSLLNFIHVYKLAKNSLNLCFFTLGQVIKKNI
jgi:hypothetical protein